MYTTAQGKCGAVKHVGSDGQGMGINNDCCRAGENAWIYNGRRVSMAGKKGWHRMNTWNWLTFLL